MCKFPGECPVCRPVVGCALFLFGGVLSIDINVIVHPAGSNTVCNRTPGSSVQTASHVTLIRYNSVLYLIRVYDYIYVNTFSVRYANGVLAFSIIGTTIRPSPVLVLVRTIVVATK